MKPGVRFLTWAVISTSLCLFTAPDFPSLLNGSVGDAFGELVVAVPVVALLTLIFGLRWREFALSLEHEAGSRILLLRLAGVSVIGALLVLEPLTGQSLAGAGVAVVLTFYGLALVVIPTASRFMLPYAAVYAAAVGAPALLLWAFGEPLAVLASGLSSRLASIAGFPVLWQGTQFQIISRSGATVTGTVTASCSSVTSVTMFLGLLALMHLDMKKDWRATVKVAAGGVIALTLLDSVRIMILLWVGYQYGAAALWGLHDWIGYAMFLGFFLTALPIYARMGGGRPEAAVSGPEFPSGPGSSNPGRPQ